MPLALAVSCLHFSTRSLNPSLLSIYYNKGTRSVWRFYKVLQDAAHCIPYSSVHWTTLTLREK